jgi:hypothetical protein
MKQWRQWQMHNSENTADPTHALPNGLSVSQDGPVTLLRLSRPAKRNALDRDMIAGIEAFFRSRRTARAPSFCMGGRQFLRWP